MPLTPFGHSLEDSSLAPLLSLSLEAHPAILTLYTGERSHAFVLIFESGQGRG